MSHAVKAPTSTGLDTNLAGALTYVLGPITGLLFLVLEKENRFVRFHAAQSVGIGIALVILSIALTMVSSVLAFVPLLGWLIALLAGLGFAVATFVLWVLLIIRAFQGREWEVPAIGAQARRMVEPVAR